MRCLVPVPKRMRSAGRASKGYKKICTQSPTKNKYPATLKGADDRAVGVPRDRFGTLSVLSKLAMYRVKKVKFMGGKIKLRTITAVLPSGAICAMTARTSDIRRMVMPDSCDLRKLKVKSWGDWSFNRRYMNQSLVSALCICTTVHIHAEPIDPPRLLKDLNRPRRGDASARGPHALLV